MALIGCCGWECQTSGAGHFTNGGTAGVVTTAGKTRGNSLRSLHIFPVGGYGYAEWFEASGHVVTVARVWIMLDSMPNGTFPIITTFNEHIGAIIDPVMRGVYAGYWDGSTFVLGTEGRAISVGSWYCVDVKIDRTTADWTVDVQVNGGACPQLVHNVPGGAGLAENYVQVGLAGLTTRVADMYLDDFTLASVAGDYPIGAGQVTGHLPSADGTHNVSGSDFIKNAAGGATISNATTDVYTFVDELSVGGTGTDFINQQSNGSSEYVEVVLPDAPGSDAPRVISAMAVYHQAGTGSGTSAIKIYDSVGSTEDPIVSLTGAGSTSLRATVKSWAARPAALGAWTLAAFNGLRIRFGYSSDANPDQYWDGAIVEADFPDTMPTAVGSASDGMYPIWLPDWARSSRFANARM